MTVKYNLYKRISVDKHPGSNPGLLLDLLRKDSQVVDDTGLLTRHTLTGIVSSNLTLSAIGLVIKWYNVAFATPYCEFDSHPVHKTL